MSALLAPLSSTESVAAPMSSVVPPGSPRIMSSPNGFARNHDVEMEMEADKENLNKQRADTSGNGKDQPTEADQSRPVEGGDEGVLGLRKQVGDNRRTPLSPASVSPMTTSPRNHHNESRIPPSIASYEYTPPSHSKTGASKRKSPEARSRPTSRNDKHLPNHERKESNLGVGVGGVRAIMSSERETASRHTRQGSSVVTSTAAGLEDGNDDRYRSPGDYRVSDHSISTQDTVQSAQKVAVKREPSVSPRPQVQGRPPLPPPSTLQRDKPSGSVTRHRPRNLDVSLANNAVLPRSALTARDGPMGIQGLGLACISPGFQPQDAMMEEKVQRSVAVREQQRQLIESRLQKTVPPKGASGGADAAPTSDFMVRTDKAPSAMANNGSAATSVSNRFDIFAPSKPSKRRPPPGLSIVPPSAQQFANDRVIQSAPLHQTFASRMGSSGSTGDYRGDRNNNLAPTSFAPLGQLNAGSQNQSRLKSSPTSQRPRLPRQLSSTAGADQHGPQGLPTRNSNRLPPLTDVIGLGGDISVGSGNNKAGHHRRSLSMSGSGAGLGNENHDRDNGLKPQQELSRFQRRRDFRSAEEAVQELTSGKEELLPRLVHYGGPLTPTERARDEETTIPDNRNESIRHTCRGSALAVAGPTTPTGFSRRRRRSEYEIDNGSPPLGTGPEPRVRYHHHLHNRIPSSHAQHSMNTQQAQQQTRFPPTSVSNGNRPIPRDNHHDQQHQGVSAAESGAPVGSRTTNMEDPTGKPATTTTTTTTTTTAKQVQSTTEEWRETLDASETQQKKDEFLSLMSRAWDIFHS